jgi:acetyl-CoA C-acetyltransferase
MMNEAMILSAARTPTGVFLGGLSSLSATDLGGVAIKAAVERAAIAPESVDEVFMGSVVQAGLGQAPARQAAIKGGIPPSVGATTVNKVCGSGLKAVMLAASEIRAGVGHCYVAGGMESMSNVPHALRGARLGRKFGDMKQQDLMISDGLWCAFNDQHMGNIAEYTAEKANLTREMLDEYAAGSQQKASAAVESGAFADEIVPVTIPQRKGDPIVVDTDEGPRPGTTAEKLARLRPAFQKDGVITAGNSPGLNDGASALVVVSSEKAKEWGKTPLARVTAYAHHAVEPKELFFSPIGAVEKVCGMLGVSVNDFDLIEANEAFAAQCLADGNALGWDWEKVNVNGGAIALGHPIGASGARVLTTLLYALKKRGGKTGLATLCLGGGEAVALAVEM